MARNSLVEIAVPSAAVASANLAADASYRSEATLSMDYFSTSALITPAWIILGAVGVLFTRKLLWAYLLVCVLLAALSWRSGVAQVREQRAFDERQKAVEAGQQQLNVEFAKLAISLRMSPNSPHEMILDRMQAMNSTQTGASGTAIAPPVGNNSR
jgi:cell division protein FtsL